MIFKKVVIFLKGQIKRSASYFFSINNVLLGYILTNPRLNLFYLLKYIAIKFS